MNITKTLSGQTKTLSNKSEIFCTGYKSMRKNFQDLQKLLVGLGWQKFSHSAADTKSFYLEYSKGNVELTIRISDHTKPSFIDHYSSHVFINTDTNEIEILSGEEYKEAVRYIRGLI